MNNLTKHQINTVIFYLNKEKESQDRLKRSYIASDMIAEAEKIEKNIEELEEVISKIADIKQYHLRNK